MRAQEKCEGHKSPLQPTLCLRDKATSDIELLLLLNTHFKSVLDCLRVNRQKSKYQGIKGHSYLIQI